MADIDIQLEVKENAANIKMIEDRLNALIRILSKEGITTKEEVDEITKEIIEKVDPDE